MNRFKVCWFSVRIGTDKKQFYKNSIYIEKWIVEIHVFLQIVRSNQIHYMILIAFTATPKDQCLLKRNWKGLKHIYIFELFLLENHTF